MKPKMLMTDGVKSINPWDTEDSPNAWLPSNAPETKTQLVPAVQASLQARCRAIADMPFSVYNKQGEVIDNSDDYKNKLGFLENPRNFFWLTEASLVSYGSAYWLKRPNKYAIQKDLQYFYPNVITPEITIKGLERFKRQTQNTEQIYKPDEILYFWLPDPAVELGPPKV